MAVDDPGYVNLMATYRGVLPNPSSAKPANMCRLTLALYTDPIISGIRRMCHGACSHHIQVNIDMTTNQVLIRADRGCTVAIFPKSAFSGFPLVVLLGYAACH